MSGRVAGKVALVSGASGRIGSAFVEDALLGRLSQGADLYREASAAGASHCRWLLIP
jgi:hypothetical protein